ncbi:MAG TPA: IucA/IucC family protein [Mycobacteriales bacterium]|nr:IucA/IucC family protein [Mycobacteriales bacterium]
MTAAPGTTTPLEPDSPQVRPAHAGTGGADGPDPAADPVAARMHAALRAEAPGLAGAFLAHLPLARAETTRRLLAAAWREDVGSLRTRARMLPGRTGSGDRPGPEVAAPVTGHAGPVAGDLARLLTGARAGSWAVCAAPVAGVLAFPVLAEHAFGRITVGHPVLHLRDGAAEPVDRPEHLAALLADAGGPTDTGAGWARVAAEVADGATNLALALARAAAAHRAARRAGAALGAADCVELAGLVAAAEPVFDPSVFLEKLSTGGHNLHPCARTRLGMGPVDLLRHDVEATGPTDLVLVGVRRDRVTSAPDRSGRDVGELLLDAYPRLAAAVADAGLDRAEFLFLPVHRWQLDRVVRVRYAERIADGEVCPVPGARLPAQPTVALRTLLTEPAPDGRRFFVKTALDVQITSTRRTISVQTAANGPMFSALLERIAAAEPALSDRVVLLPELAGASYRDDRSLTALVRADLAGRLRPGEVAVPGCALYARSPLGSGRRTVLAELVDRYAAHRGEIRRDVAALRFLDDYASVLLGATVRLMVKYGIGLEAHLQNTVPTFVAGVPARVAFRDWGGMRVHLPRLARRGHRPAVRAGSLTVTRDIAVTRAKFAYTVLQNHLGEIVIGLAGSHRAGEAAGWERIGAVLGRVLAGLAAEAERDGDADLARDVAADTRVLRAPSLPHKALVTMRLHPDGGDRYVPVPNPLRADR